MLELFKFHNHTVSKSIFFPILGAYKYVCVSVSNKLRLCYNVVQLFFLQIRQRQDEVNSLFVQSIIPGPQSKLGMRLML